jgi:hypothetical protein
MVGKPGTEKVLDVEQRYEAMTNSLRLAFLLTAVPIVSNTQTREVARRWNCMFERNKECAMTSKILRTSFTRPGFNLLMIRNMEARCGTACVPENNMHPRNALLTL